MNHGVIFYVVYFPTRRRYLILDKHIENYKNIHWSMTAGRVDASPFTYSEVFRIIQELEDTGGISAEPRLYNREKYFSQLDLI